MRATARLYGRAELEPREPLIAGELGTWRIAYRAGLYGVDDGGAIRVARRFASDWGDPQTTDSTGINYATVATTAAARLELQYDPQAGVRPWQKAATIRVRDGFLAEGDTVALTFGDTSCGSPGSEAQTFSEPRFAWKVLVDCFGTGVFEEVEDALTAAPVVAGPPTELRVVVPSDVTVGERFRVSLRAHDRWGNLATSYADNVQLVAEGLGDLPNSLAVEGGLGVLGGVHADRPGTFRVEAADESTGLVARSNAVMVHADRHVLRRFWGDLHGQGEEGVGTGAVDEYLTFARDVAFLDFTGHQTNCFHVGAPTWARIRDAVRRFHEPGRFVPFLGYEWSGLTPGGGDRNVHFLGDDGPLHRAGRFLVDGACDADDADAYPVGELHRRLRGRDDVLLVPHVGGRWADLRFHDADLEPLIEIQSSHGEFEWLLADAFAQGLRVGITCGSDDHKARPGASYPGRGIFRVRGGLVCVLASELTRERVWQALAERRCYGTNGERIALEVSASGVGIGGELRTAAPPVFRVVASGVAPIERIELRRELMAVDVHPREPARSARDVRVAWRGARGRGRDRIARWDGELCADGTRIVAARPFAFDSPGERLTDVRPDRVAWVSTTSGDEDGVVLTLEPADGGVLRFSFPLVRFDVDLAELAETPLVEPAGGLDLAVVVERLPTAVGLDVDVELRDAALPDRPTPYVVVVVQEDGGKAWSSPIWVVPERAR